MAGVYIHVPFCHAKCAYCAFYSSPETSLYDRYTQGVVREFELRREELHGEIATVYLGGGTPSILPSGSIAYIAENIVGDYKLREFTIEVNPEDITAEKVESWLALGIKRVSMGVQSLDDNELATMGRRHSALRAIEAIDILRSCGVSNLSLDLIYGIPGQTPGSWSRTLDKILEIRPEHLSAYSMTYEPHTRLTAQRDRGHINPVDDDTVADMYITLIGRLATAGYNHYEISNFSLPGYEAVHNSSYWNSTPYLGLGPAAHSFDGKIRRVNPSDTRRWLAAIESGTPAFSIDEESKNDRINDIIITALRTNRGLDILHLPISRRRRLVNDAFHHLKSGSLIAVGTRLIIPEDKWLVSDAILSDLIQL